MRIRLKAHITDLDRLVMKRTAELTRSNEQLRQEIAERKRSEEKREKQIVELQAALSEINDLRGILPLCSFCKKVRDDKGYWQQVEVYLGTHAHADISHGICPDCLKEHFPNEYKAMSERNVLG